MLKMECDKAGERACYWATMRRERLRARQEEYRKQRREQFANKDMMEIEKLLVEEMGAVSSTDTSPDTEMRKMNFYDILV